MIPSQANCLCLHWVACAKGCCPAHSCSLSTCLFLLSAHPPAGTGTGYVVDTFPSKLFLAYLCLGPWLVLGFLPAEPERTLNTNTVLWVFHILKVILKRCWTCCAAVPKCTALSHLCRPDWNSKSRLVLLEGSHWWLHYYYSCQNSSIFSSLQLLDSPHHPFSLSTIKINNKSEMCTSRRVCSSIVSPENWDTV